MKYASPGPDDEASQTQTRSGMPIRSSSPVVPPPGPRSRPAGTLPEVSPEHYDIEGEAGRGGIGVVYRARDQRLDRVVAVKELQRQEPAARARFEREMRITARLQHPGIVPVHEAGRWPSGEPFYAMKLVEGRPLKDLIAECRSFRDRLALVQHVLAVADTVAYAHSRRIVHRDLKPSNVIVGAFGETVVIDWGLAKDLDAPREADAAPPGAPFRTAEHGELTMTGQVIGTPAYMPPEQARGEDVDERADVYALGAILYHVLTGGPPYRGTKPAEILARIAGGLTRPVREVVPEVPPELEAIVAKAMARQPSERYARAELLVRDLKAFVAGQLVSVYDYSVWALAWRWTRRNKALVATASTLLVALATLAGVSAARILAARDREAAQRELAEGRAQALGVANQDVTRRSRQLAIANAEKALARDPILALSLLAEVDLDGDAAGAQAVRRVALAAVHQGLPDRAWPTKGLAFVALAPDGARVAILDHASLRVMKVDSGAVLQELALESRPTDYPVLLEWRGNDEVIGVTRFGLAGRLAGAQSSPLTPGCAEVSAAAIADGGKLLIGCATGDLRAVELATGKSVVLGRHEARVTGIANGAGRFYSIGEDRRLRVWSSRGDLLATRDVRAEGTPYRVIASRNYGSLFIGTTAGELLVVETAGGSPRLLAKLGSRVTRIIELKDGTVAAASVRGITTVVDGRGGLVATTAHAWDFVVHDDWLIASDADGSIAYVHLPTGWQRRMQAHPDAIQSMAVLPSGALLTAGEDGSVRRWSPNLVPERVVPLAFNGRHVRRGPASAPGSLVITSDDGQVAFYALGGATPRTIDLAGRWRIAQGLGRGYALVDQKNGRLTFLDENGHFHAQHDLGEPISSWVVSPSSVTVATPTAVVVATAAGLETINPALEQGEHVVRAEATSDGLVGITTDRGRALLCAVGGECRLHR